MVDATLSADDSVGVYVPLSGPRNLLPHFQAMGRLTPEDVSRIRFFHCSIGCLIRFQLGFLFRVSACDDELVCLANLLSFQL